MNRRRYFLAVCLGSLLSLQAIAETTVIDDSENFAILDEQQAAFERPVAKAQLEERDIEDEEIALARDNEIGTNDADLLASLQNLRKEVQELRGQLEVQTHDLALLRQQQLTFYKDIDARLHAPTNLAQTSTTPAQAAKDVVVSPPPKTASMSKNISSSPSTSHVIPSNPIIARPLSAAAKVNPANEQINYLAAYDLVKKKQFDEALTAMQTFVTRYPDGGYTANAQYWLGELYMVQKNYSKAIEHFEIVLQQFPSSNKAAACLLKTGYALAASGKKTEAQQRLQQVLINYPDTSTALLAANKLKLITAS